jgi:N-acetylglucosamine-6-phosphate deacetylase
MIILSGADLVLPGRVLGPGTLVIEGERITEVRPGTLAPQPQAAHVDLHGCYVVPGFIDVHVHGIDGRDVLDGPGAIRAIAARMPRTGVTAFCPTTIACAPDRLGETLAAVRDARISPDRHAARVLPAHLESNFLRPEYHGAQPLECLRLPPAARTAGPDSPQSFTGADIVVEIERHAEDVGVVTIAPEIDGALPLIRSLVSRGLRVSLGHSGASFEVGLAAIEAGARAATHLFNRMPPVLHREPSLTGAVLQAGQVAAELVCDGFHVHPAVMRIAIAAKRPDRMMAITDGTAGAGLPVGSRLSLGGRPITVRQAAAFLDDKTLAGSTLTMDRAFRMLVGPVGLGLDEAAAMCATTPARELGLVGFGVIAVGAVADIAVLDRDLRVIRTYIAGELVHAG